MSRKMEEKLSRAFEAYEVCKMNKPDNRNHYKVQDINSSNVIADGKKGNILDNVEYMQEIQKKTIQFAKNQFQQSYRSKNKFCDLLLCQLKFCGIKMWTCELLLAIATSLLLKSLLSDPYFMTTRKLVFFIMSFAIAVPMMLLPFLYRSIRYQMFEMESASVFSIKAVLFSKFLLFFGGEVLLVTCVLLVLWNTTSITVTELAGCILIPFLLANDGFLLLLKKIKSEKLCQSFLGFGIALIIIIVVSFRSTETFLWTRMTPVTVVSILGLMLYGIYESMTIFKKYGYCA